MPSIDSSIHCLNVFNMPHTATTNQYMARRSNLLTHRMTPKKFSSQPHPKPSFSESLEFFIYYGMALDLTMLVALGTLATQQSKPTKSLWNYITWFLNYAAYQPDAKICFSASDMILHIARNGSYLSESKSRSRVGGIFYLSSKLPQHNQAPDCNHPFNAPFHVVSKILKMITISAIENEVAATLYNAKEELPFRVTLAEMGHPQPPTPMEVDNETAIGFLKSTMKKKRSKAIYMIFYWVRYRVNQNQFMIYWRPGTNNVGDYVYIHHSPDHHESMRPKFCEPHSPKSFLYLHRKLPTETIFMSAAGV